MGKVEELFFDADGIECGRYLLGGTDGTRGIQIPAGTWHTLAVLEPSVIIEMKDGPYVPTAAEDILTGK